MRQEVVLSNKGPQVKKLRALSPAWEWEGKVRTGGTPRAHPRLAWVAGLAEGRGTGNDHQTAATSTTGSGRPTAMGRVTAGLLLRPCGPKWAVPGRYARWFPAGFGSGPSMWGWVGWR